MLHKPHSGDQTKNSRNQKHNYLADVELRRVTLYAICLTLKNENDIKLIKHQIDTTDEDVFCYSSKDEAAALYESILENEFLNEIEKVQLIFKIVYLTHTPDKLFESPLRDKMLMHQTTGRALFEVYRHFCKVRNSAGMAMSAVMEDELWRSLSEARVCTPQELYMSCKHIHCYRDRFFSFVRTWLEAMHSPQELLELYENFIHSYMVRHHMHLHTSGLVLRAAKQRLLALVISIPPETKALEARIIAFLNKWESAFTLFFETKAVAIYAKLKDKREEAIDEFKMLRHKLSEDLVASGLVIHHPR